jgi:hypothetical protein
VKAKFESGDKVLLLDFSNEIHLANREYNHFWVPKMDKFIGRIFTIKTVHRGGKIDTYFWYHLKENGIVELKNWGFNEHWLGPLKPLEDELFEI